MLLCHSTKDAATMSSSPTSIQSTAVAVGVGDGVATVAIWGKDGKV